MLIIFAILLIAVFHNSHGKYVNLLSEKQKPHYEKIVRRITSSVENTEDENLFDREITNEMMEQDTAHLRKRRAVYKSSETDSNEEETLALNQYNADKSNSGTNEETGLAISERRRSYDQSLQENTTDSTKVERAAENSIQETTINVEVVSNISTVETSLSTKSIEEDLSTDNLNDLETSTAAVELQANELRSTTEDALSPDLIVEDRNSSSYETTTSGDESSLDTESENVTKNTAKGILLLDVNNNNTTSASVTNENELQKQTNDSVREFKSAENTQEESSIRNVEEVTTTSAEDLKQEALNVASKSSKSIEEDLSTDNLNSLETSTAVVELQTNELRSTTEDALSPDLTVKDKKSSSYETSTSGDESSLDTESENVTKVTAKGILLLDMDDINTTTASVIDKNESENQKYDSVSEHKSAENTHEESYIVNVEDVTTTSAEDLKQEEQDVTSKRSIFIDLNEYSPPSQGFVINIPTTTTLPALTTSYIQKQPSKSWKQKRFSKVVRPSTESEYKDKQPIANVKNAVATEKKSSIVPYQVYEIPNPDSSEISPFLKSALPMKNSIFKVPLYKFSPNYAQYNPEHGAKVHSVRKRIGNYDASRRSDEDDKFKSITPHPIRVKNKNDNAKRREWLDDYMAAVAESKKLSDKAKKKKEEKEKLANIATIMSISDAVDVFPTFDTLQKMKKVTIRRNDDVTVSVYLKVLHDLVEQDNVALKRYDWLATTVQIQSALAKLFQLIQNLIEHKPVHPADVEILKYVIFLHNFSSDIKGVNRKRFVKLKRNFLPNNKRKRSIKMEGKEMNSDWLYLKSLLPEWTGESGLNSLYKFLVDLENAVFDLHEAITQISKVTKFKHQNWFGNLKQLYLTTNEQHLRELLLHISLARMVELIEHSCEDGLEDDYIGYMTSHRTETKRTLEEMVFVSNVLDDIKSSSE